MNKFTFLLIGAGNLGSRHLQSLIALSSEYDCPPRIIVIEPDQQAIKVARLRAAQVLDEIDESRHAEIAYYSNLNEVEPGRVRLSIVATSSIHRRSVLEDMFKCCEPQTLLLEKFLFPNLDDYPAIGKLIQSHHADTYVNCPRTGWSGYEWIRSKLAGDEKINITIYGSNLNVLSNAIHFIELFKFLTGNSTDVLNFDINAMNSPATKSKRIGYYESQGSLMCQAQSGNTLSIHSADDGNIPVLVDIYTNNGKYFRVNEKNNTIQSFLSTEEQIHDLGVRNVSDMKSDLGLMLNGKSLFPGFNDCASSHVEFIKALMPLVKSNSSNAIQFPVT